MKTKAEIRNAFWKYLKDTKPELAAQRRSRKKQNDYCADIRLTFIDYMDYMSKNKEITEKQRISITL